MRESFGAGGIETPAVAVGTGELTDDEMHEMILDELQSDGRVETEELVIVCEDEVVYLDGLLPSAARHHLLLEIVHDVLDGAEVVDGIRIDRQPWERLERQAGTEPPEQEQDADDLAGEKNGGVDPYTSLSTGEPMAPPDKLINQSPGR
jgi:hypothetical protein